MGFGVWGFRCESRGCTTIILEGLGRGQDAGYCTGWGLEFGSWGSGFMVEVMGVSSFGFEVPERPSSEMRVPTGRLMLGEMARERGFETGSY